MNFPNFLIILIAMALAAHGQILAPQSRVEGKTVGEWSAAYFQWAYLQPTNRSPMLDSEGARATNGQAGPVFFVAGGSYSGAQPPRDYTVPEDKYLFVPINLVEADNIDTYPPLSVPELRDTAAFFINATIELHLGLDGNAASNLFNHREISPVFNFVLPSADNYFSLSYGHPVTGVIDPAVTDGYVAMIKPLRLGTHTLVFGASFGAPFNFGYERTDIITVVPVSPQELIANLAQSVRNSSLSLKQQQSPTHNLGVARRALDLKPPHLGTAVTRLRTFQRQVRRAFTNDLAASSNLLQRTETVINRIRSQLPPITQGGVLPGSAKVAGKTIGGLEVDLWKWIYSIPTNQNPILDCGSGQWATNRQPNPLVFYIAPVNGNMPPCSRTFTIPEHKFILMPVMGITLDNIDTVPPNTIPEMRDILNSALTNPIALFATIDGVTVPNLIDHRNTAPEFSFNFSSADNVQSLFYGHSIEGLIDPIIADGYWLLVEPLSTGPHELHGGGQNIYHLPHDVTSIVTVEEVPLDIWMEALKSWVQDTATSAVLARKLLLDLNQAQLRFSRGRIRPGIAELRSFQRRVRNNLLTVDPALANDLLRYAERIINRAGKEL